jgi:pimeloyl-ACP methyl ester carboxylesterase
LPRIDHLEVEIMKNLIRHTAGLPVNLAYIDAGQGIPVIFVHEFAGDMMSWLPQINALSRRYRCIAYNARGYSPSDVPVDASAYSWQAAVADLIALMDFLGLRRAHVVGLSMGGYTVVSAGSLHPDRILSIGVCSAGSGSVSSGREAMIASSLGLADQIERDGIRSGIADYAKAAARLPFLEKDPVGFEAFFEQFASHDAIGSALTLRGVQAARPSLLDKGPQLAAICAPVMMMLGDRDSGCVEPTLFMWRTIPGATLAVLPNSGHCINLEEPEVFNRLLLDFLDRAGQTDQSAA